jgi:hypothetical protein
MNPRREPRPRSCAASETTIYSWKAKYGGMTVSEATRLGDLEAENAKLKKLLAAFHSREPRPGPRGRPAGR